MAAGSGVLFPLPKVFHCWASAVPNALSHCFRFSVSSLAFSSCICLCRSCNERLLVASFGLLEDTRLAKLSLAGVAGFEGALKGWLAPRLAPRPEGWAESVERGVDRPESWGVGLWRKGGRAAGEFVAGFLAGWDQSRPAKSSIVVVLLVKVS